jgi:ribose transport system ATP-binding protein
MSIPVTDEAPILELQDISKSFGATRALHEVSLSVQAGEIHALLGENGAGKSTLMKVLSGAHQADSGRIVYKGAPCQIESPAAGRALGIAMIYQELTLAPHLTVEENMTLGLERSRWGLLQSNRDKVHEVLSLLDHPDLPLDTPVRKLNIGLQQVIEIGRALVCDADVIIMDEPTSSLTDADTKALFRTILRLKEAGIAVIYISHFLEEVMEIADRFTALRDGESVGAGAIKDTTITDIIELMIGRSLDEMFPRSAHTFGETKLSIQHLSAHPLPHDVNIDIRAGEVLGIAGLVGAGRSEMLRALFGLDPAKSGTMHLGKDTPPITIPTMTPRKALATHIDFLSEDRKEEGLATTMTLSENTTLSTLSNFVRIKGTGLLNQHREAKHTTRWIDELHIKCAGPNQPVSALSGGNQQKVALARMLEQDADIVLLDEPTRGIDVGSKVDIYRLIDLWAQRGKAIIVVSSYLPELFGVCDTIAVMARGRLSAAKPVSEWTHHSVMEAATSGHEPIEESIAS